MSSPRLDHVFYNAHSKVSHYVLRHTSHRLRSVVEHAVLGLAVCGFCVVILSHRTFVHREDIASISRGDDGTVASCDANNEEEEGGYVYGSLGLGFIGEGRGVSVYSIMMQILWSSYAWMVSSPSSKQSLSNNTTSTENRMHWRTEKKIPGSCLKSIPGFRDDADVNHIMLRYDEDTNNENGRPDNDNDAMHNISFGSRAFTIHRGRHDCEQIVTGVTSTSTQQSHHSCVIGNVSESTIHRASLFGFAKDQINDHRECSPQIKQFLAIHGYLPNNEACETSLHYSEQQKQKLTSTTATTTSQQQHQQQQQLYSPIVYSYSHSQGLLRLQPSLQHTHNISAQFIIASSTEPNCFGEPFAQSIIFRLVGHDTVILNWILGLASARPRFVYHWKTRREMDLDVFDMDHYAFSSKSSGSRYSGAYESMSMSMQSTTSSTASSSPFASMDKYIARVQKSPLYRFLGFLTFKFLVLLSTLLIFFLTTSLVSFTFQETQDRMVEFTLQLQIRVRARMPLGGLILGHVLENLVFVPIMVGMMFFLIEFYGGDKFLAFMVLSMVWVCEVFSAISIRSAQGMHFFPRVFFLYFTLFHVYFFSCPVGFTYASLASTILFLFHTMLFFWNRYELPALHAGLITSQSPRMARLGVDRRRMVEERNEAIVSPPRIQPSTLAMPHDIHLQQPPPIPRVADLDDRSTFTAPTAPLSSRGTSMDFTPQSDQHSLLPPSYPGAARSYVVAASSSLQSIRSMASIQSSTSLVAERSSPNFIFQGGLSFNESEGPGDGEEDSYMARVMTSS